MPHTENGHQFSFVNDACQLCGIGYESYLSQGKPVCENSRVSQPVSREVRRPGTRGQPIRARE